MKINDFKAILNRNFINGECMEFLENTLIKHEQLINIVNLSSKSYRKKESGVVVDYELDGDLLLTINPLSQFRGNLSIFISKYHNQVVISDSIHTYDESDKGITKITKLSAYKGGNNSIIFEQYKNYKGKKERKIKSTELLFNNVNSLIEYKEEKFTEEDNNKLNKYNQHQGKRIVNIKKQRY